MITKPFHHSQKVESEDENGVTISLNLKINYEFERLILGFGECIKVISPEGLQKRMKEKFEKGLKLYQ